MNQTLSFLKRWTFKNCVKDFYFCSLAIVSRICFRIWIWPGYSGSSSSLPSSMVCSGSGIISSSWKIEKRFVYVKQTCSELMYSVILTIGRIGLFFGLNSYSMITQFPRTHKDDDQSFVTKWHLVRALLLWSLIK